MGDSEKVLDTLSGLRLQPPKWFLANNVKTRSELASYTSIIEIEQEKPLASSTEQAATDNSNPEATPAALADGTPASPPSADITSTQPPTTESDNSPADPENQTPNPDLKPKPLPITKQTYNHLRDSIASRLIAAHFPGQGLTLDPKETAVIIDTPSLVYAKHIVTHVAKDLGAHLVSLSVGALENVATDYACQEIVFGRERKEREKERKEREKEREVERKRKEGEDADATDAAAPATDAVDDAAAPVTVAAASGETGDGGSSHASSDGWVVTNRERQAGGDVDSPAASEPANPTQDTNTSAEQPSGNEANGNIAVAAVSTNDVDTNATTTTESNPTGTTESDTTTENPSQTADPVDEDRDDLSEGGREESSYTEITQEERDADANKRMAYYFSSRCKSHSLRELYSRSRRSILSLIRAPESKEKMEIEVEGEAASSTDNQNRDTAPSERQTPAESVETTKGEPQCPIILMIEDAHLIRKSARGEKILKTFRATVNKAREQGTSVIIVAATTTAEYRSKIRTKLTKEERVGKISLASESLDLQHPALQVNVGEQSSGTRESNVQMLKLALGTALPPGFCPDSLVESAVADLVDKKALDKTLLDATNASDIGRRCSGRVWGKTALELEDLKEIMAHILPDAEGSTEEGEKKEEPAVTSILDTIKSSCSSYEEKLFSCVIEKAKVSVSFDDVIMDEESKQSIKYLVSMSKIRFEGASTDLLQKTKIAGALLYGPPGSGKTQLARAVTKYSGSNMLSITPADIQDKYVGETEKNIQAVFSLAKKLSPCVLFIDEADAMLYRRCNDDKAWRRAELTQFLQEMDGLVVDTTSPFCLVATNRPADMDDAFMRRLPHKIMFPLPGPTERRKMLDIFVKAPDLGTSVDLDALTSLTDGYSGSDLRSLCGEAVLGFAMEHVDSALLAQGLSASSVATSNGGEQAAAPPTKLVLEQHHFIKALQKILPSVSENSMAALKAFERQYHRPRVLPKKVPAVPKQMPDGGKQVPASGFAGRQMGNVALPLRDTFAVQARVESKFV